MELREIMEQITAVPLGDSVQVTQLTHEEDGEPYQVWQIDNGDARYILKEAKEKEAEIYQSILADLPGDSVPRIYQTIGEENKVCLLMEYIQGEDLRSCNRRKLNLALNALIALQRKTWEDQTLAGVGYNYERSCKNLENRARYLNNPLLETVFQQFLQVYASVPRTLCHDDLLPFNVIASDNRAVLIDWECGGLLPYPASFARLIAHGEEKENAFFYMTREDKNFAVDYYYENLLKEKGITYAQWRENLAYFLFSEYCEWVFVGNKYGVTDGENFQKYLPLAKEQAGRIQRREFQINF